ncbi:MAG: hypothetical protein ACLQCU_17055 [Acidimicrobiales bacterium]
MTDRLVVVGDGRVEAMRKTRGATADDVRAMISLGESESVRPVQIVPSLR